MENDDRLSLADMEKESKKRERERRERRKKDMAAAMKAARPRLWRLEKQYRREVLGDVL